MEAASPTDIEAQVRDIETAIHEDEQLRNAPEVQSGIATLRSSIFAIKTFPRELTEFVDRFDLEDQYKLWMRPLVDNEIIQSDVDGLPHGIVYLLDGEERRTGISFDEVLKDFQRAPEKMELIRKFKLLAREDSTFKPSLRITPFAPDIADSLIPALARVTLKHKDHLHVPGGDAANKEDRLTLKNEREPVWSWDTYNDPSLHRYFPEKFCSEGHGGRTKARILREDPRSAFLVSLTDGTVDIPREDCGVVTGSHGNLTRRQLEAGNSPRAYLQLLQTNPQYRLERGEIPEDVLTHALVHMENTNGAVIADYANGKASARWLTGFYVPSSDDVGHFCWHRDYGQFFLVGYDPGCVSSDDGAASAVGVRGA